LFILLFSIPIVDQNFFQFFLFTLYNFEYTYHSNNNGVDLFYFTKIEDLNLRVEREACHEMTMELKYFKII